MAPGAGLIYRFLARLYQEGPGKELLYMENAARTGFFRGLALITRGWLEADAAELEAALAEEKLRKG